MLQEVSGPPCRSDIHWWDQNRLHKPAPRLPSRSQEWRRRGIVQQKSRVTFWAGTPAGENPLAGSRQRIADGHRPLDSVADLCSISVGKINPCIHPRSAESERRARLEFFNDPSRRRRRSQRQRRGNSACINLTAGATSGTWSCGTGNSSSNAGVLPAGSGRPALKSAVTIE